MSTSKVNGIAAVAVVAALGIVWVSHEARQHQHYAEVVSAKLVTTNVEGPRQRCYEESVTRAPEEAQSTTAVFSKAVHRALNRRGKTIVNDAPNDASNGNASSAALAYIEQRCETVYDSEQQPAGYDVKYRYGGKSGVIHMDHDPGKLIPVENGELVLNNDSDDATTPG